MGAAIEVTDLATDCSHHGPAPLDRRGPHRRLRPSQCDASESRRLVDVVVKPDEQDNPGCWRTSPKCVISPRQGATAVPMLTWMFLYRRARQHIT